jgi:hypothetical protein
VSPNASMIATTANLTLIENNISLNQTVKDSKKERELLKI